MWVGEWRICNETWKTFVQELRDELQKPKKKKFMTPERKKKLRQVLTTIHQHPLHLHQYLRHLHLQWRFFILHDDSWWYQLVVSDREVALRRGCCIQWRPSGCISAPLPLALFDTRLFKKMNNFFEWIKQHYFEWMIFWIWITLPRKKWIFFWMNILPQKIEWIIEWMKKRAKISEKCK